MVFNDYTSPYEVLLVKIGRPMLCVLSLRAICIETFKLWMIWIRLLSVRCFLEITTTMTFETAIKWSNRTYAHSYVVRTPFAIRDLNYGMSFRQIWRKLHISYLWWRNGMVLLIVVGSSFKLNWPRLHWRKCNPFQSMELFELCFIFLWKRFITFHRERQILSPMNLCFLTAMVILCFVIGCDARIRV